ncbi:hypothetical protein [Actinomadura latina]|uniref:Uncharacterized protein n=1 Tax=Actinomadura latina TaxID=163603 RepID=A0A846Z2C7_9ACTN|nr:hypothetical protein [Actinomadura latina]NKZ07079.1 hypothetical protein [Actinomadura latina]
MYHHDFMQAIMRERTRDLRTRAEAERDARLARRAREYWADRAERFAVRRDARRPRRHGAEPAP